MNIDTFHRNGGTEVRIIPETAEEKKLTDAQWATVACNQHLLLWSDAPALALLPPSGKLRGHVPMGTTVCRNEGGGVTVTLPLHYDFNE